MADDEVLIFKSTGNENNYANIFKLTIFYLQSDWFLDVATKCNFYKFDDSNDFEDILLEVRKESTRIRLERLAK